MIISKSFKQIKIHSSKRGLILPGNKTLEKISSELIKQKKKISTAESCTGGLIAHYLTNISGSSNFFDRSIVAYSNIAKIDLLNVSKDLLEKHGAVSKEVAYAMAEGIRKQSNVDIGLSTTGIAGPTGGNVEKPVGLVYIAISTSEKTNVKKFKFSGNRLENKTSTLYAALNMLYEELKG